MPFSILRFSVNALSVCFLLVIVPEACACKVPVFRYALEHWYPDPYQVVILHRGAISDDDEALVAKLEEAATDPQHLANLEVRSVDVEQEDQSSMLTELLLSADLLGPDDRKQIEAPEIVLLYPRSSQSGPLAWQGPLTPQNIEALINSPARRQITDWILAGESAVWVLIGVGDAEQDKLAEETLRKELALLEDKLELRDIEIIEAESQFGQDTSVELRLGLKLLVLDRDDPKEKVFATTLLRSDDDLEELGVPVAIAVFGRGRAFLPLAGSGINPDNIEETCRFLIGDCSCESKRFNPGVDLLFAINWDDLVVGSAGVDPSLPDLSGLGLYAEISLDEPETDLPSRPREDSGPGTSDVVPNDQSPTEIELTNTQTPPMPSQDAHEHSNRMVSQQAENDSASSSNSSSNSFGQRLTISLVVLIALGVVLVGITTARLRSKSNQQ